MARSVPLTCAVGQTRRTGRREGLTMKSPAPEFGARPASFDADQHRQLGQRAHLAVRIARQALAALAVAVAPDDLHAEGRGGVRIPGVRRLEGDSAGGDAEPVDGELIDLGMRLVDTGFLD